MSELKIFIAGSKDLKLERNGIKIIANDLSSLYSSRGIHITAHSYEHFDENQDSYNRFIVNEADIVIFILDGYIGAKTEEEFVTATKSLHQDNHPDVMVFMHEYDGKSLTPDVARIQGLIMGCLGNGKYHVDYSSLDDLKAKAKERIMRYVDKHVGLLSEHPVGTKRSILSGKQGGSVSAFWKRVSIGLSFVTVMLAVMLWLSWSTSRPEQSPIEETEESMLVFSGGGSVIDYIKNMNEDSLDVKQFENSIYINLPSGSAWALLFEEAVRLNEEKRQPYVSIVLSADKLDIAQMDYRAKYFSDHFCVAGLFLGYDTLAVYVENELAEAQGLQCTGKEPGKLTAKRFVELVSYTRRNPDEVLLFTTNKSSGTLRMYQRVINAAGDSLNFDSMLDNGESFPFYQNSSSDYLRTRDGKERCSKKYIMLGSESFYSRKVSDYSKFHLYSGGDVQKKEMYIYFMAYKNQEDEFCFSPHVLRFLEKLGAEKILSPETWSVLSECRLPDRLGNTVFYLNK